MKNIFVGNLDFAATEASVRALFEPYGNVERVNLVTDRDTGRSRGFAFVEMTDAAQADQAIAACGGDLRATVRALIVANNYLETEVAELMKAVSHAYARGRFQTYTG